MNLATLIDEHPDHLTALVSRGRPTTYGALRSQVGGLRGALVGAGLEPGDRVGILCGNNRYFVASYLAVIGAGLVAVPLNPLNPSEAMVNELATVEARAVIVGPASRSAFESIDMKSLPSVEVLIGCGFTPEPGPSTAGLQLLDFDRLIASDPVPVVDRAPDDLAVLVFTSGTAGAPKAAMLTQRGLYVNIRQVSAAEGRAQHPDDVVLGVSPLNHIFGLNVILGTALYSGSTLVLIDRFDPIGALEVIAKYGVTVLTGAPAMWAAWAGLPDLPADVFRTVRIAVSGAARLPVEVSAQLLSRFGLQVQQGYGLTEASPAVSSSTGTDAPPDSIGVPLPGVEVRLVDEAGDDVYVGDPGELYVRGPNVFAGYWRDPETTAAVVDSDGWLHTGDIAVVDEEGYLYIVDRRKDLIIVSGFNVFPLEVEEVLARHPDVAGCAVIGVPHPHTGEAVRAYVQLHPGASVDEDDLIAFCTTKLARYKCPKKVWFVDEIPRDPGGKLLRRILRESDPA